MSGKTHHHAPHPWGMNPRIWDRQREELAGIVAPRSRARRRAAQRFAGLEDPVLADRRSGGRSLKGFYPAIVHDLIGRA
jgi:hypothetical protein